MNGTRDDTPANEAIAPDPVHVGRPITENSSFPPGAYNKTRVGATGYGRREVMRAGRMWVCLGDLIAGLDVRLRPVRSPRPGVPMGGTMTARPGDVVEAVIRIDLADRSVFHTPYTKVEKSWEIRERTGTVELVRRFTVDGPCHLRVRGTDGKRVAPGYHGSAVDPAGSRSTPWARPPLGRTCGSAPTRSSPPRDEPRSPGAGSDAGLDGVDEGGGGGRIRRIAVGDRIDLAGVLG
ncbi:hypothetical protein [Amycolatopsis orientalis]|uniref:hypothetical protein n=1 Tax=Amycolatopsis orientalis TaxID=31958 RepID=UPI0012696FA1|nr:hypothetical protein [Amycolatopsis orientalis]